LSPYESVTICDPPAKKETPQPIICHEQENLK